MELGQRIASPSLAPSLGAAGAIKAASGAALSGPAILVQKESGPFLLGPFLLAGSISVASLVALRKVWLLWVPKRQTNKKWRHWRIDQKDGLENIFVPAAKTKGKQQKTVWCWTNIFVPDQNRKQAWCHFRWASDWQISPPAKGAAPGRRSLPAVRRCRSLDAKLRWASGSACSKEETKSDAPGHPAVV